MKSSLDEQEKRSNNSFSGSSKKDYSNSKSAKMSGKLEVEK